MTSKKYHVREVARFSRVTVRTLHHYDEIGLLVPSSRTPAGYRLYDDVDLLRLQQILIHRELGFSLSEIGDLIDAPDFDQRAALMRQRAQLSERAAEVARMIEAVDTALAALEGEAVDPQRIFDGFDPGVYEKEVEARWGNSDAFREAGARTKNYSEADWQKIKDEQSDLMRRMADLLVRGLDAGAAEPTSIAEEHRRYIERWFYPCSHAMHAGLAQMYVDDDRYAAPFEAYGDGLSDFFAAAIRANAEAQPTST